MINRDTDGSSGRRSLSPVFPAAALSLPHPDPGPLGKTKEVLHSVLFTPPPPQEGLHPQHEAPPAQHLETPDSRHLFLFKTGNGCPLATPLLSTNFFCSITTPARRVIGIPTLHVRKLRLSKGKELVHSHAQSQKRSRFPSRSYCPELRSLLAQGSVCVALGE